MTFTQLNGLLAVLDSGGFRRAPRRLDHLRPFGTIGDTSVAVRRLDPPAPAPRPRTIGAR